MAAFLTGAGTYAFHVPAEQAAAVAAICVADGRTFLASPSDAGSWRFVVEDLPGAKTLTTRI